MVPPEAPRSIGGGKVFLSKIHYAIPVRVGTVEALPGSRRLIGLDVRADFARISKFKNAGDGSCNLHDGHSLDSARQ
jgi:hypothetical protein